MSAMPGMWVQSAVCADVARCGSGMSGMWPRIEHISLLLWHHRAVKIRRQIIADIIGITDILSQRYRYMAHH